MIITRELIEEFITFYKNQNLKKDTIRWYELEFQRFYEFLQEKEINTVEWITMKIVEEYRTILTNQETTKNSIYFWLNPKLSPRTVQTKLQPVKKFLEFTNTIYNIWINYQLIKVKKVHSKHMDFFEKEEIWTIIEEIDNIEKYALSRARAKLLVIVWFVSGMRISEMLQLKVKDIMNWKAVILWKWDKEREVYFNEQCKEQMQEYLKARNMIVPYLWLKLKSKSKEDWAFISHHPNSFWEKVSVNTLCDQMKKINDHLNINWKKFSAHTMRHSSATYLLDRWVNLREIQMFLGHSNLSTTETYVHIRNKQVENTHKRIFWE